MNEVQAETPTEYLAQAEGGEALPQPVSEPAFVDKAAPENAPLKEGEGQPQNLADASDVPAVSTDPVAGAHVGAELSGKIGSFGEYFVDLQHDGKVVAEASAEYDKSFAEFVSVKAKGQLDITGDLLGGLVALGKKSSAGWVSSIAGRIGSLLKK